VIKAEGKEYARQSASAVKLEHDNNEWASGRPWDPSMSFVVMVETTHVNRGSVTNSHSKQAANRSNKLLKGHRAHIAKIKKQNDNQD
jgi:hypothetical protein